MKSYLGRMTTSSQSTDEELMLHYLHDRDQTAFSFLYNRYFDLLGKYIAWLCRDLELAKDVCQQVFIKVYEYPELFNQSKKFKPWIFAIAQNQWKNHVRNAKVAAKYHERASQTQAMADWSTLSDGKTVDEKSRFTDVSNAVQSLSSAHKEVFLLKYSSNLTIQEISEVCDCSEGTVKSRLFYSIKKIRAQLALNQKSST